MKNKSCDHELREEQPYESVITSYEKKFGGVSSREQPYESLN